jgi:outer membrane receptor protein involved in Fe transport
MGVNVNSKNEFMDFVDEQELGADGQLDFYQNTVSINSQGTTVFSIQPYVRLNFDELNIYLGLRGTFAADSTSEFHVYPAINLTYQVIPDYLQFYAGISGGLQRNSFRSVSDENPWINPVFPLGFTNTKYQFKGGFTGKIDMVLDYNFSVAYADVEDMLFFVNIFSDPLSSVIPENLGNKFTGIYDDVQHTTVKAEFAWQQSYNLTVSLAAEYNNYKLATELKPWHKPAFNTKLGAKYQLNPRISLSGEIYYRAKVYAKLFESDPQMFSEVNSFADLSLGGEYQFNDRVSAFLKLNNLTGTQYYRWYNYPMQRFNAMAGLTFSF